MESCRFRIKPAAPEANPSAAISVVRWALWFALLVALCSTALAATSITPASGGLNISADKAANATSPAWTSLGTLTISEGNKFDFNPGINLTLILKSPAGFEFNTSVTPNIAFTAARDITSASIAVTDSNTLTITLTVANNADTDQLTIGSTTGIQVRPTAGTPLASGQIFRPTTGGGTAVMNGVTSTSNPNGSGGSNFGSLSEAVGAAVKLTFTTQPGNATTGAIFGTQPVVRSQDQFGNNSTNGLGATVNVSVALTAGTGPLLGTTTLNIGTAGGDGTVTYANLQIDVAGIDKQLTATAAGLTSALSSVFTVNARPTISTINNQTTNEDVPVGPIPFTVGDAETAAVDLVISRFSSNTNLVPLTNIVIGGSGSNRTVTITPATDLFGAANITLSVSDGIASASNSFSVTVNSANDPPTLNALTNRTILEEAGTQIVNLSGIGVGTANEAGQTITITASSSDPAIIPNPIVTYTSPNSTGSLSFAPLTNQFGSVIISVVVRDNGGTNNGGIDALTNSFTVLVAPVNDRPTLNTLTNRTISEDAGLQTVNLAGISPGPSNESTQSIVITANSSNPTLIPAPTVSYTNGNVTGTLTFTPATNQFGTATISVVVTDDGGTSSGGINAVTNSFTVTVQSANDPPTLNTLTNLTIVEDAGTQILNLTGISPGPSNESAQAVTITATSGNPSLIPNPTVNYTSGNTSGTLSFASLTNLSGAATITVIVTDNGGTTNGGINALTNTFNVTVLSANDRPTMNALTNLTILEEAATQIVGLSGITPGPTNETSQTIAISAFSSNPSLIPNPTVNYTNPNSTGTLSFTPLTNQSGTATISVVVQDNGGTANGGIDSLTNTFTVTVQAINDPPTLASLTNRTILEDAGLQIVNLSGITAGPNEASQVLTVTATSSDPALIPNPTVNYTSPNATGTLNFSSVSNQFGTATITVVVSDNGGTANGGIDARTNSFTVTVVPVNDTPTLVTLTNRTILEDGGLQTVNLTGISPGPSNESTQAVTITATSGNSALIPNPTVNYTSGATGTLTFTPVTNQFGSAVITVVLQDNGGTTNSGVDALTNTFTVTVNAVNDAPTLDPLANLVLNVNPGPQTVNLSGIGPGPINENSQVITVSAVSSNIALVPHPSVSYVNPNATGTISFTPVTNASGSTTIAVVARDNGGTNNGGQDMILRQFTLTVTPVADLRLSQTITPNPGYIGGTVTSTLTVSNSGPTTSSGIQVTNILPLNIGVVTATSSQGTCTNYGSFVVCNLGILTNQGVATVSIGIEPLALGNYTNSATVSSAVADPNLANNSSTATFGVIAPHFTISATSLAAENCVNSAIDPAEPVTVNFSVQNTSGANTTNLVATLRSIGGITVPGAPQNYGALVAGGASVSRPFSFVPIGICGGSVTATLQLQDGPVSLGSISTTLMLGKMAPLVSTFANFEPIIIPSSGPGEPYPSSVLVSGITTPILKVTATFNTLVHSQPDDLDILLVSPGGQKILLMSDAGGINAVNGVTLTFDDSAAAALPDASQIVAGTWKPTDFQPTDTLPDPAPGRPYSTNLASLNGLDANGEWKLFVNDDIGSFSGFFGDGWQLAITSLEPNCCVDAGSVDLTLGIFSDPEPVVVGNLLTNMISVMNLGPASATGVFVTNPLPAGAVFVSATSSQGTCTNIGNAYVCNLGTLANSATADIAIALIPGTVGPMTNQLVIRANQPDFNPSNNVLSSISTVIVPSISIIDTEVVAESETNVTFTAQLSSPSSQTIVVNYATSNDTATAGMDYVSTNGTLIFTPGQISKTIEVHVNTDSINEATEFFTVNLINPSNVTLAMPSGVCTIIDDDPVPNLSINDITVTESHTGTNANFTLSLSPVGGQIVLVSFSTANGSALAGTDFVSTNGTIGFEPGQTNLILPIPLIGDRFNESNETFVVNLSAQVNANLIKSQGSCVIVNDDFLATIGAAGSALAAENCAPTNGAIDPNETVTVNISLRNISAGTASTTNLVATLLQTGGITAPGAAQTYGALAAGGAAVSRPFTFIANGDCGDTLAAVLQLQDGTNNLGTVTNLLSTGKGGTATNSYTNSASLTIVDGSPATPYPSQLVVSNLLGTISKVTASFFNFSHTYPSDIDILLVGPSGQAVMLMSDAGGGNPVSGINITLDDAAALQLPGSQITSGTYRPADYEVGEDMASPAPDPPYAVNLSAFNGTAPAGTWRLYVFDDTGGDAGAIAGGWRLTITTLTPPACCGPDSSANMAAVMTGPAGNVPLGSNITYTIAVTNLGPHTASDVVVTDPLPGGVNFISANSTIGVCTNINGIVSCNLGTMTNSARATITVVVTAVQAGNVTNVANVAAWTSDPNVANNASTVITTVIPPAPVAAFTASPLVGFRPLTVTFSDTSSGVITNRFWNFGDGSTTNTTTTNFNYTYNTAGTNTVTLMVSGPGGTDSLIRPGYIQVTNLPPLLVLTPTNLSFGAVFVGQTNTQAFELVNSGGLPLNGTASVPLPFRVQSGSPFALAPGQTGSVLVSFSPTAVGSFSNAVTFLSNGGNRTNPVTGSGVTAPQLAVTPAGTNFGLVEVGSNVLAQFVVTNLGSLALSNGSAAVSGGPFAILSGTPFNLPGFGATNVIVRFSPTNAGNFSNVVVFATANAGSSTNPLTGAAAIRPLASFAGTPTNGYWPLTITFSDTSTGTITNRFWDFGDGSTTNTTAIGATHTYLEEGTNTVSLTVSGPLGTNHLSRPNYITVTNGPLRFALIPSSMNFGAVVIGNSVTQSFQIVNIDTNNLSGSMMTFAPFAIPNGAFNVAPGETGIVDVAFSPGTAGSFSNAVFITSNGGNSTNSVFGTGLTPAQLAVTPPGIHFGTVAVGSNVQATFTVTNLGGETLNNGAAALNGGPFDILSGAAFTLPGFSSTGIVVRFAPGAAATFSNVLLVTSANAGNSTNAVTGVGAVVPTADFSADTTSGLKPLTVTFTDSSTGTITNRFWNFGDGSTSNTTATVVAHTYSEAGSNSVTLRVTGPVGTNTLVKTDYIIVTNLPPQLVVSPSALTFGSLVIGQTSTQNFQVVNAGGLPLNGSVAATPPFSIGSGSPFNIAPGQTGIVAVSFSPADAGNFNTAIVFTSNGGNSTNNVSGSGLTPPQLAVLPASLDFGTVGIGSNVQASFTVTNTGGAPLSNGMATVDAPFSIISGTPFNLAGFGTTNVMVRFAPNSAGSFSNTVVFLTANGGSSTNEVTGMGAAQPVAQFQASPTNGVRPLTVNFTDTSTGTITNRFWDFGDGAKTNTTATGVAHTYQAAGTNTVRLTVSGPIGVHSLTNFNLIAVTNSPPLLVVSPQSLNFGQLIVGESSTNAFMISNAGGQVATGFVTTTLPFQVPEQFSNPGFTLAPGESNLVNVIFTPGAAGSFSNVVRFFSNGGNQTNAVQGTSVTPGQLIVLPSNLVFPSIRVGSIADAAFTVTNAGGASINGVTTTVTGGPFTLVEGATFDLPGFAATNVLIRFAPSQPGNFTNSVVFASSAGNSTNTVNGSGLIPAQLAVIPSAINFGIIAVGSNAQATLTVTNTGGEPLTNGTASVGAGPFSILSGTPFNLAGLGSTNVIISFAPGSAINFSNAVLFTSANGGSSTNPVTGTGAAVPVANFTGSPTIGLRPLTVTFSDTSSGTITNRFWNFGDGSTTNTTAIGVTHTYTNGATNTVALTVTGPVGTNTLTRNNYIRITNLPPQLVVNPAALSFGPVVIGHTNSRTFEVINGGEEPLAGSASTASPFAIQSGSTFNLAPGQTGVVAVSFAPGSAIPYTNQVVFTSNGGNSTNQVTGSGLTPGQLAVLPSVLDFGVVLVNSNTQASFTVTNLGGGSITNVNVSVSGGPFTVLSGTPFSVAGFGSTNISIRFAPTNAAYYSNVVLFTTVSDGNSVNSVVGTGAEIPIANFIGNPTIGTRPLTVNFTDNSTGTITNRFWNFGDGETTNTSATSLTHTYLNAGTYSVSVTVSGPLGTNTQLRSSYINATNPPSQLVVSQPSLNFGPVTIGQTNILAFEVINNGGLPLNGSASATLPWRIESGTPFSLGPGQTGSVQVSFAPTSAGSFSNVVTFTSSGGNSVNPVTGTGLTPAQLSVLPASIHFGAVGVGSNVQASFTVTNTGGTALSNGTATVSGGPFTILSGTPFNLPGFGSTNVIVRFTPPGAGNYSNVVVFTSGNDGNSTNSITGVGAILPVASFTGVPTSGVRPLTVNFTDSSTGTITNRVWDFGDGDTTNTTAASLSHTYLNAGTYTVGLTVNGPVGVSSQQRNNYISVTNLPPQLLVSQPTLSFGPVTIGQTNMRAFEVVNNGGLPLNGSASANLPWRIESGSPFSLAPGQTGIVQVSFAPTSAGSFSNVVSFTSNGGNSTNPVTGTGLTPAQLSVLPVSINFGTLAVGSNVQASFTVTNTGGSALSNGTATVSGGPFTIISGTPFNLPGFGSTNLVVRFTPPSAGNFSNVVIFTSGNDGSSTNSITGTGAVVPVANFAGNPTSGLRPLTVNFTDSSTGTITNRFWNFGDGDTTNTSATSLSHTYLNAGTYNVSLTVSGPVGTNTQLRSSYINATNLPPQLVVSQPSLNFGPATIGQTNTLAFEVVNHGGLPLNGSASANLPWRIESGTPFSLAPGQTGIVQVSFAPTSAGSFSNVVIFTSNGGNSTNPVTGTGLTPAQLSVLPASINFGTVAVGSNVQASFTVTNTGGTALSNGAATVSGGPFTILSGTPFNLPGFGATNVVVRFTPPSAGNFSNVVVFASGNAGGSTNSISGAGAVVPVASFIGLPTSGLRPLAVLFTDSSTGTITDRFWDFGDGETLSTTATTVLHTYVDSGIYNVSLRVSGPVATNTQLRNGYIAVLEVPPELLLIQPSLDFGTVIIGQTNIQTFEVVNIGGLPLLGSATANLPWRIESGSPFTLLPGQTGLVQVSFAPGTAGNFSNVVTFASNGGNSANPVTGAGLTPAQLSVLPASINFGTVAVGSNMQAGFTVTNTGGAALSNGTASVSGGPFSIVSGTSFNLPGFGSTNVVVRFTPSSAGSFSNVVVFTSGNSSTNSITGTGAVVPVANFAGDPTSGLLPLTVNFTDSSTGTITNRFWDFGDGNTTNTTATSFSYTYVNAGSYHVRLTIRGPVGTNTHFRLSYINATNLPPQLAVSQPSLNFGPATIGQTNTLAFEVVNNGGLPLNGSAAANLPWRIESGSPFSIAPGQTGLVQVSFAPTSAGSFSNVVTFTSNGGNSANPVTGTGLTAAQLSVLPGSINFGLVAVGSNVQAGFTVTNTGGAALNSGIATVSGGPFTIVSGTPFNLPGFGSTNVIVRFTPSDAGNFSNVVVFTSGNDGTSINSVIGTAAAVPAAGFTANPTTGVWPLAVTFTDTSTGTIGNRTWDFGDGTTLNTMATTVSHIYTKPSTNTVSLTVRGPVGTNTMVRLGYISIPDQLVITSIARSGTNVIIRFTSQAGRFYRLESAANPTGPWLSAVPFVAGTGEIVQATHAGGAAHAIQFYRVKLLTNLDVIPVANFTADPVIGRIPLTVTLVDQSSGWVTNRFWDFGDGTTTNTSASVVSHTYTSAGTHTVSLLASGPLGASGQTRPDYIVVTDVLRITDLRISDQDVLISFNSQAGKLYRVEYSEALGSSWKTAVDFVPGTGNIVQTVHPGGAGQPLRVYRVKLLTDTDVIPVASFTGSPTSGPAPLTVTFTDSSTGWITNRFWNFGDGTITNTTAATVSKTYTGAGTYTVSLMVSGPFGINTQTRANYIAATLPANALRITDTRLSGTNVLISFTSEPDQSYRLEYANGLGSGWLTAADLVPGTGGIVQVTHFGGAGQNIRVYRIKLLTQADQAPSANFTASPRSGQAPLTVTFTDISSGLVTSRTWDFGDGSSTNTTLQTVTHTYTSAGPRSITLTVNGPSGSDELTRNDYVMVGGQLRISRIEVAQPNVLITFTSTAGKSYRLEHANSPSAATWSTAVDQVPGTGAAVQVIHPGGAGQASRFYRIRELP